MKPARLVLLSLVAFATVVPALGGLPASAGATAATSCLGQPVTIVASKKVTSGTEGDDVVAMTPGGWNEFDALGGNDTICLALGAAMNGRDVIPPFGVLYAGPGDDVVVNESAAVNESESPGAGMRVYLGAGDDTYAGSGTGITESVHADAEGPVAGPPPTGTERDVIDMGGGPLRSDGQSTDEVWSSPPGGGLNADVITFGSGSVMLHYEGVMAPDGLVELSAATHATLNLPNVPSTAASGTDAGLLVDAPARRVTVGGVQVLTWQGLVHRWQLGSWDGPSWRNPLSFRGTDAAEELELHGGSALELSLGGGDDTVDGGYATARQPRSLDGGPGTDWIELDRTCSHLAVRLDTRMRCDGVTTPLTGFEEFRMTNRAEGGRMTVIGTDAGDRVSAYADRLTFHGRRGADRAGLIGTTVRANGGPGADKIRASGIDVGVRGQGGPDSLIMSAVLTRNGSQRQVALGGPGRDYCDAEVTRRCERGPRTTR